MAFNFIEIESLVQVFSSEFCEVSKNTFFTEQLRTTVSVFSFFPATLLKWDTAKSVRKTLRWTPLSRNTNLRSNVQIYHFFLYSINFQCMFSLVYTVYCTLITCSSLLLLLISLMFDFGSFSQGFKQFKSSISFSMKSFSSVLFSISMYFVFLSFVLLFLVAVNKKDSFKSRID